MLQLEFKQVTETVYNEEYQWALEQLNKLVADDPTNSNLYSNRALLLSQLNRDQQAVRDLNLALELNPRNYIAYFNLFSALYRLGQDLQAFQQLCCSLSCLHLMRARLSKSIEETDKAIKYSYNNVEAHVLKGLIFSTQGKHLQAYSAFDQATSIDPSNNSLFELRALAFNKAFPGEKQAIDYYDASQYKSIQKKLKSSYRVQNVEEHHFNEKLAEFNALYSEINGEIGAVTQKVIKTQTTISSNEGKSGVRDGVVVVEDVGQPTPKQSEIRPEPGNIYMRTSKISVEENKVSKVAQEKAGKQEEEEFKSIANGSQEEHEQFSSILYSRMSEENKQISASNEQQSQQQNQACLSQPVLPQQLQTNTCNEQELQVFQSMISVQQNLQMHQISEQAMQQQYNLIYPLDQNNKLKVSVLRLEFTQPISYADLYCIVTYKAKLTTVTKPTVDRVCCWNQQFDPVEIPTQPGDMRIKVYNKKYQSIRDEYIGEVEVLITTADLLRLPIFNKKGEHLGEIIVQLQLVQQLPQEQEQVQEGP